MDREQDSTASAQERRRVALLIAAHSEADYPRTGWSGVAVLERPDDEQADAEFSDDQYAEDEHSDDEPDSNWVSEEGAEEIVEGGIPDAEAGPEPSPEDEKPAEKPRKKKKRDDADAAPLGTSKAVETMFRNAIRAELDIIALAATKANIMISLNGFIISALMISGAFLFNSSPSFLIPAAVFILTSAGSITFALLAASPERAHSLESLKDWWRDRKAGEATWSDLSGYLMRGNGASHASGDHQRNLLIYEDRVQVSHDDFWGEMQALLRDRDEIYRQMSDHLYWLGQMANRKFKLLNVSYSVFRWGLVSAIATFLLIKSTVWAFPALAADEERPAPNLGISEFSDIYEPSAVQQLPDGRILVVEDEASRAVSILSFGDDGRLIEDNALDLKVTRGFGRTLSDLEGLSVDDNGFIYAITSHSPTKDDERKPEREQLLRFQIKGGQVGEIGSYTGLYSALAGADALRASILEKTGEEVDFEAINIEGLSFHKATGQLLLGMRSPMVGDESLIIVIENPVDVLTADAAPQFGEPIVLDLQGGGIRALSYDPVLGSFLIVNEIEDAEGDKMSQMWTWSGNADDTPTALELPGMINLNNVESVDSVTVAGEDRLLIMSDEGNAKKNEPAKYLLLDYAQLPNS
ncbi:MAG: DUF5706 domain-containing protein [Actinomycetia bacterium]|nr:DUF5706 domain-containing protein [Actinomycetes bacterium]